MSEPGLYVHVPFCSAICPYCDFAVVKDTTANRRERYTKNLLRELETRQGSAVYDTLYFGGGTPSLLEPDGLGAILGAAQLTSGARVFLEGNPEDVDDDAVSGWKELGVDTLTLGIQSFQDKVLDLLGRCHSADASRLALEVAKAASFDTVSIDLIFGWPGQGLSDWRRELDDAVALEPDHISCYQLTVQAKTMFGRRKREGGLVELDDTMQAALFRESHHVLGAAGYDGYEVSNFARGPEHRSRHNEKYWNHTPYLGVGPSAHTFDGRASRSWNVRSFFAWEKHLDRDESPVEGSEVLDDEDLLLEALMLRFRMRDGVDFESLEARFGVDLLETNRELVSRLSDEGLVDVVGRRLSPTIDGLAVADSLASAFELQLPHDRCQHRSL